MTTIKTTNTGKVKFYNEIKLYGFIKDNNSENEYFFHVSGTTEKVRKEDQVSFDLESGERGFKAVNIKRIKQ
jgi:CspA family cold shock protein